MPSRLSARLRAALASPPALFSYLIVLAVAIGLVTTPPEYQGVRDQALFARIFGMFSTEVFRFIGDMFYATVAVALATGLFAAFLFHGLGVTRWRRRALFLVGGWYLFLLAACLRAPALFEASLMRIPIFDPRFVFLLSKLHFLSYPIVWGGLYLLPAALLLAAVLATVRLRWWPLLAVWPALVYLALAPHLDAWRQMRALRDSRSPTAGRSVLVVALDSLRSDFVNRAPALASLEAKSLSFPQTIVPIPRTAPSLVSFFRSQYPIKTGVSTMFPSPTVWNQTDRSLPTYLRSNGYHTFALSDYVGEFLGKVDLGFERVSVPTVELAEIVKQSVLLHQPILMALLSHPVLRAHAPKEFEEVVLGYTQYSDPDYTLRRLVREVAVADAAKKPFFGFLFLSAPHFPYASLFPYYSRFADWKYRGPFPFQKAWAAEPGQADQAQIRALFAGALAMSDDTVDVIARLLEKRGVGLVITGDHGELLYDAPGVQMGHGDVLATPHSYTVPLIFHDPLGRWPRGRQPAMVRSIDFAPTLVDLLRKHDQVALKDAEPVAFFIIPGYWDGVSLLDLDLQKRERAPLDFDSLAYCETEIWMTSDAAGKGPRIPYPPIAEVLEPSAAHGNRLVLKPSITPLVERAKHRMVLSRTHKLLYKPTQGEPIFELYDRLKDPGETTNLAARDPALTAQYKEALRSFLLGYRNGFFDDF